MDTATPSPASAHRGAANRLPRLLKPVGLVVAWIFPPGWLRRIELGRAPRRLPLLIGEGQPGF